MLLDRFYILRIFCDMRIFQNEVSGPTCDDSCMYIYWYIINMNYFLQVQVAIKCLSKEKLNQGVAEFLKEASNMHSLDHDHIVRLYGVVLEADALMLVSWAKNVEVLMSNNFIPFL